MRVEHLLNGEPVAGDVAPHILLVEYLREVCGLTGTKIGCETSVCGACTVLVDDLPVKSCTMLAVQAGGSEITTIEGLTSRGDFAVVSEAMAVEHAVQCGFCTPGLVASLVALLHDEGDPREEAILSALDGHLCRCTGYVGILRAVRRMASLRRGESPAPLAGTSVAEPIVKHEVGTETVAGADVEVV